MLSKVHAHVYKKTDKNGEVKMVPNHVDNGLYLLVTPYPGHGMTIQTSNGNDISTDDLSPDSVLVLMGNGLTNWYLSKDQAKGFHAVPHSVQALEQPGTRSIMAMMKIAPDQALVNGISFKAMFENNSGLCTNSKTSFKTFIIVCSLVLNTFQPKTCAKLVMTIAGWVACLCQIHHVTQMKPLHVTASKMTSFVTQLLTDHSWTQLAIGNALLNNKSFKSVKID